MFSNFYSSSNFHGKPFDGHERSHFFNYGGKEIGLQTHLCTDCTHNVKQGARAWGQLPLPGDAHVNGYHQSMNIVTNVDDKSQIELIRLELRIRTMLSAVNQSSVHGITTVTEKSQHQNIRTGVIKMAKYWKYLNFDCNSVNSQQTKSIHCGVEWNMQP
jgi:hypothetical protein